MQGSVWACQTVRILYWAVCAYRALDGSGLFADEQVLDFGQSAEGFIYTSLTTTFQAILNMSETTYSTFRQVPASAKLTHAGEPLPYGLRRIGT